MLAQAQSDSAYVANTASYQVNAEGLFLQWVTTAPGYDAPVLDLAFNSNAVAVPTPGTIADNHAWMPSSGGYNTLLVQTTIGNLIARNNTWTGAIGAFTVGAAHVDDAYFMSSTCATPTGALSNASSVNSFSGITVSPSAVAGGGSC